MGSNKLPYFPFHVDDYLNEPAVMQMDADTEGCYIRMLAKSWKSSTPGLIFDGHISLMADGHRLVEQYRILYGDKVRCETEESPDFIGRERWEEIEPYLKTAFDTVSKPGYWIQRRMVREYERLSANLRARQAGADKTNAGRGSNDDRNGNRTVTARSPAEEVDVDVDLEVEESKSKPTPRRSAVASPDPNLSECELPGFVSRESWRAFVEHRKATKSRLTPGAARLALSALGKLHESGSDSTAVIEQSILNGWKGLFAVKATTNGAPQPAPEKKSKRQTCTVCSNTRFVDAPADDWYLCQTCEADHA